MEREVLTEIREVKERLSVIEYLLKANLIPEVEPTADERRAVREFQRDLRLGKEKLIPLEEALKTTRRETKVDLSRRARKKGR